MKCELNELIWLNSEDAARYLRISKSRLHNLTSLGRLKYHKFGRSNRYKREDLDNLIVEKCLEENSNNNELKEVENGYYTKFKHR